MSEVNEGGAVEQISETVVEEASAAPTEGEGNTSDPAAQGENGNEAASSAENPEDKLEFVEKDGKQFIPKERFDQINDRMKKAEEAAAFLESLRTDPSAAKQFLDELQEGAKNAPNATPEEKSGPTPTERFISESVPKEHHEHYKGLIHAIAEEVSMEMDRRMAPLQAYVGQSRLAEVNRNIPDFGKYQVEVARIMKQTDGKLSPEQAYKIAAFDDRFAAGQRTGLKKVEQHNKIINKAPLNKNKLSSSGPAKTAVKGFDAHFDRAWDKNNGAAE